MRKAPSGKRHIPCIDHVQHDYMSTGWLCVTTRDDDRAAAMVTFADHLAAVAARHTAAEARRLDGGRRIAYPRVAAVPAWRLATGRMAPGASARLAEGEEYTYGPHLAECDWNTFVLSCQLPVEPAPVVAPIVAPVARKARAPRKAAPVILAEPVEPTSALETCNGCDIEPASPDSVAGYCDACERAAREPVAEPVAPARLGDLARESAESYRAESYRVETADYSIARIGRLWSLFDRTTGSIVGNPYDTLRSAREYAQLRQSDDDTRAYAPVLEPVETVAPAPVGRRTIVDYSRPMPDGFTVADPFGALADTVVLEPAEPVAEPCPYTVGRTACIAGARGHDGPHDWPSARKRRTDPYRKLRRRMLRAATARVAPVLAPALEPVVLEPVVLEPEPAVILAPVVASAPVARPTCHRCGQLFRKNGAGLAWHLANRPDCAGTGTIAPMSAPETYAAPMAH